MAKTTKTMLRLSPLGIVASALLFAGCVAPAGALNVSDKSDGARDPNVATHAEKSMSDAARAARLAELNAARLRATGSIRNDMSSAAYAARLREANNVSDRARDPNVATTGTSMSDAAYDAWRTHREAVKPHDMSDAARAAFARLAVAG